MKNKTFITPQVEVYYSSLQKPTEHGKLEVSVYVSEDYKRELDAATQPIWKDYCASIGKKLPFVSVVTEQTSVDEDGGAQKTGKLLLKARRRAQYETDEGKTIDAKVTMVDANKQPISVEPYGGSTVRLSFAVRPYAVSGKAGLSASLLAVQVIKQAEYKQRDYADVFDVVATSDPF